MRTFIDFFRLPQKLSCIQIGKCHSRLWRSFLQVLCLGLATGLLAGECKWVSIRATRSPAHSLCVLWTASSSSRTTCLAMVWLCGRLGYVPVAWTAPCVPAQCGQLKSGSGGKGAGTCWRCLWYFFPCSLMDSFGLYFLRILHPTARCPDCPFYLGCKFSLSFQKAISDYCYLEIPWKVMVCQLGILIFFGRLPYRILACIYCMTSDLHPLWVNLRA